MFAKIPYYSSAINIGTYDSMFPVIEYRNYNGKNIDEIENIIKEFSRNDYAYRIYLIGNKDIKYSDNVLGLFTLFLGIDRDCQFKILRIKITEKIISFEFVCPRMIPENRKILAQLMENKEGIIKEFWNKVVRSYYKKEIHTGIGILQQEHDKPIVELANYIYSFNEIYTASNLIKSIVGNDEYDSPVFNTNWISEELHLNFIKKELNSVLLNLYQKVTVINTLPFYTEKPERKDIIYGDYGWPYKEEQNMLEVNNQHLLKNFSDWESCLEILFLNMGQLMMKEDNRDQNVLRFGYTLSCLIKNVLIYSSVPFKSSYPLSLQSWLDLRVFEGAIVCKYVLDRENNRWTLVYQPSIDFSTPALRLFKLISLIYTRLIKNIGENLYNSVCDIRFWDNIIAVIYNNIEFPTLSRSLNMDIELNKNLIVINKPTRFTLLEYAFNAGMFYVHNGIVNVSAAIKKFRIDDDNMEFTMQVTTLIKEIFHLAIKYNVPTKQIQNITNYYLVRKIDFSSLMLMATDFKAYLINNVFPYLTDGKELENEDTSKLINYYNSFSKYLISVNYHSEQSQFIQLREPEMKVIGKYQKIAILSIVLINVILGIFRLHNKDKVVDYMKSLYVTGLSSALGLSSLANILSSSNNVKSANIIENIKKILQQYD